MRHQQPVLEELNQAHNFSFTGKKEKETPSGPFYNTVQVTVFSLVLLESNLSMLFTYRSV